MNSGGMFLQATGALESSGCEIFLNPLFPCVGWGAQFSSILACWVCDAVASTKGGKRCYGETLCTDSSFDFHNPIFSHNKPGHVNYMAAARSSRTFSSNWTWTTDYCSKQRINLPPYNLVGPLLVQTNGNGGILIQIIWLNLLHLHHSIYKINPFFLN